jgi:hypothetical protein
MQLPTIFQGEARKSDQLKRLKELFHLEPSVQYGGADPCTPPIQS